MPLEIKNSGMNRPKVRLGDFSWCMSMSIVTDDCARRLRAVGLEMRYDPVLVRTEGKGRFGASVKNPFFGQVLWWPQPELNARVNEVESGVPPAQVCTTCGKSKIKFKYEGLRVELEADATPACFRIQQHDPRWIYLTEQGKRCFETAKIENVNFVKVGTLTTR